MARLDNFITQYRDETERFVAQMLLLRDMRQKAVDLGAPQVLTDAFTEAPEDPQAPDIGNPDVRNDNQDITAADLIAASASIEAIYSFARDNGHLAILQIVTP